MAQVGVQKKLYPALLAGDVGAVNTNYPYGDMRRYGADTTGVQDSTASFAAMLTAVMVLGCKGVIPYGSIKVSAPTLIAPVTGMIITGRGRGSIIVPTGFVGKVLSVQTGSAFPENALVLRDFVIRAPAITVGQIGIGTTINSFNGVKMRDVYTYKMDVGFHLRTAQFCSFIGCSATQGNVGLKVDQDAAAGGGNNNTWLDCIFSYNAVGVMLYGNSIYPMGINTFINLTTHVNSICPFYANNVGEITIENWAPEANGAGGASVIVDGLTIQNSILHAEGSQIWLPGYNHASNTQPIIANAGSQILIGHGASASIKHISDATSFVTYNSIFRHFSNTPAGKEMYALEAPIFSPGGQQSSFLTEPLLRESRSFLNEAGGDVTRTQAGGGTTAATAYAIDTLLGLVLQSTYSDGTKQLILNTAPASYITIGTRAVASFLVQCSDSSAQWDIDFGQSTAFMSNVTLEAGKWYRVVLTGALLFTPRGAFVTIKAKNAAAFAATLKTARMHAFTVTDPRIAAIAIRRGIFNPNQQPEGVSADRGDANVVLVHGTDAPTQRFTSALTANRTVTLPVYANNTIGSPLKAKYRIVRTGLGAFTLDVGGLKTIPAGTAAWVEVEYSGAPGAGGLWVLTGYGTL